MARSREHYKYQLRNIRQRLAKGERYLREMESFMVKHESQIEILQAQIKSLNRRADEYDTEIPKQITYIKNQRCKIKALEKILRHDREIDNLQKERERQRRHG